ncbi:LysE/ArgO family amino acid transporter [Dyella caseinilytica]|uniref:LysE/ArgO family amino acid transporter n=1 Tax=Dyella caseinilytica TaxID=1849581 RepID=UPI0019AFF17A|nr:LysE/ArgO family amino acid transporter [Dyella caseinilytica]GGA12334.1 amino acid transporter [Dyella caseinilytica]
MIAAGSAHAPFLAGLLLGASLIVAIGAQNAFVLRQGLLQAHRFPVALFCAASDALLIAAGVGGLGMAVGQHPRLLASIACIGTLVLVWYGIQALRRAFHPHVLTPDTHADTGSMWRVIATCAGFTWLNPHVYLDTVLLIGSLASAWPVPWPRALFAIGAVTASFIWFFSLAYGARLLAPLFRKPMAWRVLDGLIAIVMWSIATKLLLSFIAR